MYQNKFRFKEMGRVSIEPEVDIIISERLPGNMISMVKSYRVRAHGHVKDMPDKNNLMLLPNNPDVLEQLGQAICEVAQGMRDNRPKSIEAKPA